MHIHLSLSLVQVREADTIPEANQAKAAGITLMTVGVTSGVKVDQLRAIASEPQYVLTVDSFDSLTASIDSVISRICQEVEPGEGKERIFIFHFCFILFFFYLLHSFIVTIFFYIDIAYFYPSFTFKNVKNHYLLEVDTSRISLFHFYPSFYFLSLSFYCFDASCFIFIVFIV